MIAPDLSHICFAELLVVRRLTEARRGQIRPVPYTVVLHPEPISQHHQGIIGHTSTSTYYCMPRYVVEMNPVSKAVPAWKDGERQRPWGAGNVPKLKSMTADLIPGTGHWDTIHSNSTFTPYAKYCSPRPMPARCCEVPCVLSGPYTVKAMIMPIRR